MLFMSLIFKEFVLALEPGDSDQISFLSTNRRDPLDPFGGVLFREGFLPSFQSQQTALSALPN
jgi:hypothetical protein